MCARVIVRDQHPSGTPALFAWAVCPVTVPGTHLQASCPNARYAAPANARRASGSPALPTLCHGCDLDLIKLATRCPIRQVDEAAGCLVPLPPGASAKPASSKANADSWRDPLGTAGVLPRRDPCQQALLHSRPGRVSQASGPGQHPSLMLALERFPFVRPLERCQPVGV